MKITIRKPVWHNRSISIRKSILESLIPQNQEIEVQILAKPYTHNKYFIRPSRAMNLGRLWIVKGVPLINFPIDAMELREPKQEVQEENA